MNLAQNVSHYLRGFDSKLDLDLFHFGNDHRHWLILLDSLSSAVFFQSTFKVKTLRNTTRVLISLGPK